MLGLKFSNRDFLRLCFILIVAVSIAHPGEKSSLFSIAEGNLFIRDTARIPSDSVGKSFVGYGKLSDTGNLNLFDSYSFEDNKVLNRRYYVKDRVLYEPYKERWFLVTAKYTRLGYDSDSKNEIEIIYLRNVTAIDNKVKQAGKNCSSWVVKNKNLFDLNEFKQSSRFKELLSDLIDLDLNSTKFTENDSLVFFDFNKMVIGIDCGKHLLRKNIQRADFLNYIAIFNLRNMELMAVRIIHTGYFLE